MNPEHSKSVTKADFLTHSSSGIRAPTASPELTPSCVGRSQPGGEGWGTQRDLDRLERGNCAKFIKHNEAKCLAQGNPKHQSRLGRV